MTTTANHHQHGGMTMDANNPTPENTEIPRRIPTPADIGRQAGAPAGMASGGWISEPGRPAHATPLTELAPEQRTRVEALHAARRVLGNPINREGQLPAFWAESAVGLADYIVTGTVVRELYQDDGEQGDAPEREEAPAPSAGIGVFEVDLEGDLPSDMPPQVKQVIEGIRTRLRQHLDPETRRTNLRKYVDEHRDKPDGYKELHAQGIFPVDGSEPPRSEALHDIDGRRWTFNRAANVWERQVTPADIAAGPHLASSPWGIGLAEYGPFHSCLH